MSRDRTPSIGTAALASVPIVLAGALVAAPLAAVVWRASGAVEIDTDGSTLESGRLALAVARSAIATGIIALLAVLLAAPVGWAMRGRSWRRLGALVVIPMLLPNYFAYAGLSMLRAPRTYLGDLLASSPSWVSVWAGPVIAVTGLTLWSWPMAAMVVGSGARRVDQGVLDTLDIDGAGPVRRLRMVARLLTPSLVTAFLLVMLVMMGSMVPLDVANVETYSVLLLRWLNLHPSDVPVWRSAWPLLIVAVIATLLVLRATAGRPETGGDPSTPDETRPRVRPRRALLLWVGGAWALSVLWPGLIYVLNLREPPHAATWETIGRFLGEFWQDSGGAAVSSAGVSARVWGLACVAGVGVWYAASLGRGWRRAAILCAGALLAAGIMPGVLVGTAIRRGGDMVAPALGNSTWMVVWAHLSRFAFVAALMGLWLARTEGREARDMRLIDGGTTPRGFGHACLARQWPAVVGAGLAAAILSFHEIEATVMVWPPGSRNLAQEMLDALHYAKDERLAAAAVNLMGAGAVLAYAAGWLAMGRGAARSVAEPPTS